MNFFSINFIFIFLPIAVLIHALAKEKQKNVVLLISSIIFFCLACSGHYEWLVFVFITALFNYAVSHFIEASDKNTAFKIVIIGSVFNAVLLLFFKYFGTAFNSAIASIFSINTENVNLDILLPLGISFYTFKNISYIHEVYKKEIPAEKSFINYLSYILMFPEIVSGPIQTYKSFSPFLTRKVTMSMINAGLTEFIFGLALKQVFSNRLGVIWSSIERIGYDGISTPLAWIGILSFSLQLYFDFHGYSLMARGIGMMLGYDIPKNFDYPYLSRSISEFWRRWHITLGAWFKENIYFPLGGSRTSMLKVYRNLLFVWALTGIWHGNTFNYVIWGLFLFVFIALEKSGLIDGILKNRPISHIYTLFFIIISWLIFKIEDVGQIPVYLSRLFPLFTNTPEYIDSSDWIASCKGLWTIFIGGFIFATPLPRMLFNKIKDKKYISIPILLVIFWYSVYLAACSSNDPFMYGNY